MTDRADRSRAMFATLAIHVALGILLVTGLKVGFDRADSGSIDIFVAPEQDAEPKSEDPVDLAPSDPAPAGEKADPMPREASSPVIPMPASPAADRPGDGDTHRAGASDSGSGEGAGGAGSGDGGGGGVMTPARLISGGLSRRDYRAIRRLGLDQGSGDYRLLVGISGTVEQCAPARSSGSAPIDTSICAMLIERLRFAPARDGSGDPVRQFVHFVARWGPR